MSSFLRLAAPRIQAPLAAVVPLVLIAVAVMQVARIPQFSPLTMHVGPALVGAISLPAVRLLFRRQAAGRAYLGAALWPPLLAAFVGPVLVVTMRMSVPTASFSFAGVSLASLGPGWPLLVAILSATFGLLGSVALTTLVWLVARAVAADEQRGARRFTVMAWSIALGSALLARLTFGPSGGVFADAGLLLGTSALVVQAGAIAYERRRAAAPAGGPYRG